MQEKKSGKKLRTSWHAKMNPEVKSEQSRNYQDESGHIFEYFRMKLALPAYLGA